MGQTFTQGEFSHCWHCMGIQYISILGYSPVGPTARTRFQYEPSFTLFSYLQATVHESHPEHLFRSITSVLLAMMLPSYFLNVSSAKVWASSKVTTGVQLADGSDSVS